MNQPAQPGQKRESMPMTAEFIDRKRREWGAKHVNDCIRRAIGGEAGLFYAMEGGHVLGTPFPFEHALAQWQNVAIVAGVPFAAFIREPAAAGGTDGAH